MVVPNQLKNQHILWRAGFGPMAEDLAELRQASPAAMFRSLLKHSSRSPEYLDVADGALKGLMLGIGEASRMENKELSPEQKKEINKQSVQDIKSLNLRWLDEMINSDAQLLEKTALFWHGHFASRNLNIFYQQLLLDIIRRNALGNFGDILREVSKSAAMINFLNNNQNRKDHPNENFAREVMELFTMGRGHYSESDVKEAARAFTGWGANNQGEFVFRTFQHDAGTKTFLGRTGNFDGDDILNILLEEKQTARFIASKLYKFFVNDQPDPARLEALSLRFYQSGYDIKDLLGSIFTSEWFYEPANIGIHVKSPVEWWVGIRRILPMQIVNPEAQLTVQRLLGQLLFYPPNVAGWPGGINWIDSSTLMFRLRAPQVIYASDTFEMRPKDDDDQMMGMEDRPGVRGGKKLSGQKGGASVIATIDWHSYLRYFDPIETSLLEEEIARLVLQVPQGIPPEMLIKYIDRTSREDLIRTVTIQLMSTPEYQLC
jgi:uncharacterized protein (DUF1800 family)